MPDFALRKIASTATWKSLRNRQFLDAGDLACNIAYLSNGILKLEQGGKVMGEISAESERARQPLFRINTKGLSAVCVSKRADILLVDKEICEKCLEDAPRQAEQHADGELSEEEELLFAEIMATFNSNSVDLPSLPDIANRINTAINDDRMGPREVADMVRLDPVISARLINMANSPIYPSRFKVTSLNDAISRVGLEAVRSLVMIVIMKNLFGSDNPEIHRRMKNMYTRSVELAALSQIVAEYQPILDNDRAMLAGLLSNLGIMAILVIADKHPDITKQRKILDHSISGLHGTIGGMLLERWGFESDFVTAAKESEDYSRDRLSVPDYCDAVISARIISRVISGKSYNGPPLDSVPALKKFGITNSGPKGFLRIITSSRARIQGAMAQLHGGN
ncbi:MAG: HDOD domain-containing protein [Gammaproteobacteria bacterium]|nr:HDOD domain-containing protein [Gammaproteobacteria bacterium]